MTQTNRKIVVTGKQGSGKTTFIRSLPGIVTDWFKLDTAFGPPPSVLNADIILIEVFSKESAQKAMDFARRMTDGPVTIHTLGKEPHTTEFQGIVAIEAPPSFVKHFPADEFTIVTVGK